MCFKNIFLKIYSFPTSQTRESLFRCSIPSSFTHGEKKKRLPNDLPTFFKRRRRRKTGLRNLRFPRRKPEESPPPLLFPFFPSYVPIPPSSSPHYFHFPLCKHIFFFLLLLSTFQLLVSPLLLRKSGLLLSLVPSPIPLLSLIQGLPDD